MSLGDAKNSIKISATELPSTEPIRLPEDFADPDREPLETAYGMPFPLDFFRLYECMARLSPHDPLTAFSVVGLLGSKIYLNFIYTISFNWKGD